MTNRIRTMIDASRRMRQAEQRKAFTRLRQREPEWYEGPHFVDRYEETRARWDSPVRRWLLGIWELVVVVAAFAGIGLLAYAVFRAAAEI